MRRFDKPFEKLFLPQQSLSHLRAEPQDCSCDLPHPGPGSTWHSPCFREIIADTLSSLFVYSYYRIHCPSHYRYLRVVSFLILLITCEPYFSGARTRFKPGTGQDMFKIAHELGQMQPCRKSPNEGERLFVLQRNILKYIDLAIFKKMFILRERQSRRGRERIPSRLHVVSAEPDAGLELVNCDFMS